MTRLLAKLTSSYCLTLFDIHLNSNAWRLWSVLFWRSRTWGIFGSSVKLHEGLKSTEVPNFESNIKWNNNLLSIANSKGLIFHRQSSYRNKRSYDVYQVEQTVSYGLVAFSSYRMQSSLQMLLHFLLRVIVAWFALMIVVNCNSYTLQM